MNEVSDRIDAMPAASGRGLLALAAVAAGAMLAFAAIALAPSTASAYVDVPQLEDTNPDPDIFEAELSVEEVEVEIADGLEVANAVTFNGTIPGPEIRVKRGDRLIIHFTNNLTGETAEDLAAQTIHWHGIELNNFSDGTAATQNGVEPGETYTYDFIVPRAGIFWYHSHFAPTNPTNRGMYASLIVTDSNDELLQGMNVLPGPEQTKTLHLADVTVCKQPGQNDPDTFPPDPDPDNPTVPWAGAGVLSQPDHFPGLTSHPSPQVLCENPLDDHGHPTGGDPHEAGEVPNVQLPPEQCDEDEGCKTNEGQHVLANGRVPADRAGSPDDPNGSPPGPLDPGAETLEVEAGQPVRLQLLSPALRRYFRLQLTDDDGEMIDLVRVGGEGGLLDEARLEGGVEDQLDMKFDRGEILLAPANRWDVIANIPADAAVGDVLTVWTRDFRRGGERGDEGSNGFARLPTVPVLHLEVVGAASEPREVSEGDPLLTHPLIDDPVENLKGSVTTSLLDPSEFPDELPGSANATVELTVCMPDGGTCNNPAIDGIATGALDMGIPGVDFRDIPHPETARFIRVDDVFELAFNNRTGANHPLHPHGFSFQPLRIEKVGLDGVILDVVRTFDYQEFVDTFDIPASFADDPDGSTRLVFRAHMEERPAVDGSPRGGGEGRWVFHCHIFHHATVGMISETVAVDSPVATATPDALDLGEVQVADVGEEETIEISNPSLEQPDPLEIDEVTRSGPDQGDFAIVENECDGQTLGTDESCAVTVRLEPTARGPREAALEVGSNDRQSPLTVPLTGIGAPTHLELTLNADPIQRGLRRVVAEGTCVGATCQATARGRLLVKRKGGRLRALNLGVRQFEIADGTARRFNIPIPAGPRRAARRALIAGGRVRGRIKLRAVGAEAEVIKVRMRRPPVG